MQLFRLAAFYLALSQFGILAPASSLAEPAKRPNVLLILTDNQSYHEIGCHDHIAVQTPHIDKLCDQAVDFTNFHAPNYCSPSRASLLTGRYPLRYGVHNTIGGVSILHKNEKTMADHLKAAGYKTGIFGKWHLGMSYPYAPRYRGFDEAFIHGGGGIGQMEDAYGNTHMDARYWHNGKLVTSQGFSTDVLFNQAISYIEKQKDHPFFCFISTPATHKPFQAHPKALERLMARGVKNSALYSMIENIDDNVGKILGVIDKLGLTEQTIVIFASDQGMQNRGARKDSKNHPPSSSFDQRTHVFYMLRYPPITEKVEGQSQVLSGMVDVLPTVLDLTGVKQPNNLDGRSQRPLLTGGKWQDDRIIIFQCPRTRKRQKWKNVSIKTQKYRMISQDKLFDIKNTNEDISGKMPEIHHRLVAEYNKYWDSLAPEQALLCRHELGPVDTRLCAMDWYQGRQPWNKSSFNKLNQNGSWAVEVTKAGKYHFELRHFPREAEKSINATRVTLNIGDKIVTVSIKPTDAAATLSLNLNPGQYDMTATFTNDQEQSWGSLFAYVSMTQ